MHCLAFRGERPAFRFSKRQLTIVPITLTTILIVSSLTVVLLSQKNNPESVIRTISEL